ncbi:MAG: hypothetical protein ACI8ZF_000542 [Candidatus Midichloriaceae bacterium]|jgi:hypothetical protein
MYNILFNTLHVLPLFVILAIYSYTFLYNKYSEKTLSTDFTPTILLLCTIGVASGYGTHHAHDAPAIFSTSCYACLGYSAIIASVAYKLSKNSNKKVAS